jgi:REP element-mobilizing transposase RayT
MSVLAHHLVWTAYGTWLGNDPRGSGSRNVYTPVLASLGEVHYGRRSVQPSRPTVREFYMEATPRLQFPVVRFDDALIQVIGRVFSDIVIKHRYTCYACAIMPDHVHLVIRKHRDQGKAMIEHFQRESRLRFSSLGVVCPIIPCGPTAVGTGFSIRPRRFAGGFGMWATIRRRPVCGDKRGRLWWRTMGGRCIRNDRRVS